MSIKTLNSRNRYVISEQHSSQDLVSTLVHWLVGVLLKNTKACLSNVNNYMLFNNNKFYIIETDFLHKILYDKDSYI